MDKKIKVIAIIAVCILVILQISALFIFSGDQIEDSEDYRDWAIEKADSNSFYPDETDANEKFMANPGFINYLSVFYRITNNDKVPIAANIVLVIIMAACVYFIAWKLFKNKIVAWLSILLLAVFPTFIGEILNLRSEILFTTLAYAAVAVFLSNIKFKYVLCGILLALANWVRPLGLVFLLAILLYMLLTKVKFRHYIKLLAAVLAVVLVIGTVTYIYSGNFVFQSVTAGVNFIMGANDDADGSYSQYAFRQGRLAVIEDAENKTYVEKDSIWTSRAIDWIMNNPGKYIALIPAKLFYMYSVDTYAFSTFYNNKVRTSGSEYIKPLASNVLNLNFKELTWVDYVVILNQIIYMALLVMMLVSFIYLLVKKKNTREVVFVLAILVLGTGMTIITVGGARYHYPYLPIFFIMSAALIYNLRSSRVSRKNPKRS